MPIAHVHLRAGKPEAYRQAILDGLYGAMRDALAVPEDDRFMTLTEHPAENFRHGTAYGVTRSADTVYFDITVFVSRTPEQKRALFRHLADRLAVDPGIRPEDVFVIVHDAPAENWSVGNGLAQFC